MRSCGLSDESLHELLEVQARFRLPSVALVEKDLHVVRAIAALAAIDAAPFALVFGGGTALARAHKLVRRMSEDVDFKIVPTPAAPVSRSSLHRQRSALRDRITVALQAAGFAFDPKNQAQARSRDESSYTVYQLPYKPTAGAGQGLRPTIQVELNYAPMRRVTVTLPVASFVAEAMNRPPEVPAIACVGIMETAAEKLVSLTRRTAMDLAGASRDPDPALVRHIYDLHMMREHLDPTAVVALARDIATADAKEFRNQYPAYAADIAGETRKALDALRTNPLHRKRYDDFIIGMVYGERPEFNAALATVIELARKMIQQEENGTC
jgi:Nucleotidyl transferase AbiEii toxin, Type IV TA system